MEKSLQKINEVLTERTEQVLPQKEELAKLMARRKIKV